MHKPNLSEVRELSLFAPGRGRRRPSNVYAPNGKREKARRLRQIKAVKVGTKRTRAGAKLRVANGVSNSNKGGVST